MSTNYFIWNSITEESLDKEIQISDKINLRRDNAKKKLSENLGNISNCIFHAKQKNDAALSKNRVEALKAQRRKKRNGMIDTLVQNACRNSTSVQIELLQILNRYQIHLTQLIEDAKDLIIFTEMKSRHFVGFQKSLSFIKEAKIFSKQLKINFAEINISNEESKLVEITQLFDTFKELENCSISFLEAIATYLCIFSLSIGSFFICIDMSRFVLKQQGQPGDARIWIIRALAFIGIGNVYIAKLHIKRAYYIDPEYPGFDQNLIDLIDNLELNYIEYILNTIIEKKVENELESIINNYFQDNSSFLKTCPDLAIISIKEISFLCNSRAALNNEKSEIDNIAEILHIDDSNHNHNCASFNKCNIKIKLETLISDNIVRYDSKSKSKSQFNLLYSKVFQYKDQKDDNKIILCVLYNIIKNTFYEAQLLFLESMFHCSEIKYFACIFLINEFNYVYANNENFGLIDIVEGSIAEMSFKGINEYITCLKSACYSNVAVCKVHNNNNNPHSRNYSAQINDILILSNIELTKIGIETKDSIAGRLKHVYVLEKSKSFEAALNNIFVLKELLNNSECLDNSFFINDYDENQLLSQNHMFFILSENESLDNIVNEQTFEENKRIIERLKLYCDSKEKYFKFQLSKG